MYFAVNPVTFYNRVIEGIARDGFFGIEAVDSI